MTVEHLFTMTSGIRYDLALPAIRKAVADTQGRAPTVEIARAIASAPLAFEPGSHFHYSLSHDVLAAVVEVITGMPFREYATQAVLQPCGMMDSGFHAKETECSRFARQYRFDSDTQQAVPMAQSNEFVFGTAYDSGGAGLYSSVGDLMCLMRMLTRKGVTDSGARILRAETVDAMRTNRLTPVQLADFGALRFAGYGYGLGVRTMMDRAGSGTSSSVGEFGWYGAAGIYLLADPEQKLAMCYAQQVRGYPLWQLHPVLRNLAYEALNL
jgi:CubicO group peptidase (beta-lactamase class C family)